MNIRIILLLCLFSGTGYSVYAQKPVRKGVTVKQPKRKEIKPDYSLSQLNGKWQEISRKALSDKSSVPFTDTLLLNFNDEKIILKYTSGMKLAMTGEAQIVAPNSLIAAGEMFSIHSLYKGILVIDDGTNEMQLQKKEMFNYESFGHLQTEKENFAKPIQADMQLLKGKWVVYSKQAEPGTVNPKTAIIRSLDFSEIINKDSASGAVLFYVSNISETLPCTMKLSESGILVISGQYRWSFSVYKLNETEFVFGESSGLLYFSKHL